MFLIIGFLFLLLELSVFRGLAARFGFQGVIIATVVTSLMGFLVLRFQGRLAQARVQELMQRGADPAGFVLGIMARTLGGVLLLVPGFITDVLGLTLLLPFTRPLWRRVLERRFGHGGIGGSTPFVFPTGGPDEPPTERRKSGEVVDADYEVIE